MASPLASGKPSVDLARTAVPGSRIRRDPVPIEKELVIADIEGRDARMVIIGVAVFALAIVVASLGLMAAGGWTAKDYVVHVETRSTGA